MPRRPDTPCSGCGTLIWSGTGSLPAEKGARGSQQLALVG